MPRGRHRHSPPLHRLLPPTAIAGVSLVCALGPWMFSEPAVLRVAAAVAAATAAVGAAVMRRWDVEAGKRVADLTRARASDEWRHEEKVVELETDLDESRELRTKLEHKLRAKRTELANLRNEHAALLRRYATAETERASALEGRRLLEIETIAPEGARALPAGGARDGADSSAATQASPVPPQGVPVQGAPWASWETASKAAKERDASASAGGGADEGAAGEKDAEAGRGVEAGGDGVAGVEGDAEGGGAAGVDAEGDGDARGAEAGIDEADEEGAGAKTLGASVFSPSGSSLFLRANSALDRIMTQRGSAKGPGEVEGSGGDEAEAGAAVEGAAEVECVADGVAETGAAAEDAAAVSEADADTGALAGTGAAVEVESGPMAESEFESEFEDGAVAASEGEFGVEGAAESEADAELVAEAEVAGAEEAVAAEAAAEVGPADEPASVDSSAEEPVADTAADEPTDRTPDEADKAQAPKGGSPKNPSPKGDPDGPSGGGIRQGRSAEATEATEEPVPVLTAEEDDPTGKSVAAAGHDHAAAEPVPVVSAPTRSARTGGPTRADELTRVEPSAPLALPAVPPTGHFAVPTAVAVVPAAPQRRAAAEGGFDFFGTQKGADALEAVQNEDLADVVGQEALALHKAESEARFKRADEASRAIGQVIDLTAHDETEQIDVQRLRTAAS